MLVNLDLALQTLARDPQTPFDLAELALLLARDEYSFLDVEGQLKELDSMAQEVKPYLRGHLAHQVQGLCRYLFHEMGFRGNQREYYDPRNSYLNQVLERRLGIPITLSAVMMAVGARAGLTIEGIGLPGHFIVRAVSGDERVLIDPFHGGRILSMADCQGLLERLTGEPSQIPLDPVLMPVPVGLIVKRMLNNLRSIYWDAKDWRREIRVLERLRQLEPDDAFQRRDLGMAYCHHGQPGKAIDHLRAYLQEMPQSNDLAEVRELLTNAEKTVAQWN